MVGAFVKLRPLIERWEPDPALGIDSRRVRATLYDALEASAGWLLHPCLNALTLRNGTPSWTRDLQAAVWAAASTGHDLGDIYLPEAALVWTSSGGEQLPCGWHELSEVGRLVVSSEGPGPVALDLWCVSLGFTYADTWAAVEESDTDRMRRAVTRFYRAISWLESNHPACADWIASATRVAIPLATAPDASFRSSSTEELPGVVLVDLSGDLELFEGLIHETAHLHLYRADAVQPLVDPDYTVRHASPLRSDARPLRGILMAAHALAYICAFYTDVAAAGGLDPQTLLTEKAHLYDLYADAEVTLVAQRAHLTAWGRDFLHATQEVAAHGCG
jgi:HEXXH motif-containing protein